MPVGPQNRVGLSLLMLSISRWEYLAVSAVLTMMSCGWVLGGMVSFLSMVSTHWVHSPSAFPPFFLL